MGKRDDRTASTIENRVYLFRDLAAAYLAEDGGKLTDRDAGQREAARIALADLAFIACVVADSEDLSPDEVRAKLRK
jgi:hypothetical protein